MEKKQIYEKLNENMQNLETIENEISMIELAMYQKKIEKLKEQKLKEVKVFFEQQASNYNQKSKKYGSEINKNIEKYEKQIEKLINTYDNLYINLFRIMQNARNNQKIAMANIITLTEKLEVIEMTSQEVKDIQDNILACAQKKLNYAIMIEECKARIQWCIERVQEDMNEIFANKVYQMQIYKKDIVNQLRKIIANKIVGKSRYKRFLENYETEYMKDIKLKNEARIFDVIATLKGIMKQMEIVKEQIAIKYEQMIGN